MVKSAWIWVDLGDSGDIGDLRDLRDENNEPFWVEEEEEVGVSISIFPLH